MASDANLAERANVRTQIARTLYQMGHADAAVDGYRTALPLLAAHWGPDYPYVLRQKLVFGYALWRTDRLDAVAEVISDLLVSGARIFGAQSAFVADVWELQALTV